MKFFQPQKNVQFKLWFGEIIFGYINSIILVLAAESLMICIIPLSPTVLYLHGLIQLFIVSPAGCMIGVLVIRRYLTGIWKINNKTLWRAVLSHIIATIFVIVTYSISASIINGIEYIIIPLYLIPVFIFVAVFNKAGGPVVNDK